MCEVCVDVCVSHRVRKRGVSVWRERSTNRKKIYCKKERQSSFGKTFSTPEGSNYSFAMREP